MVERRNVNKVGRSRGKSFMKYIITVYSLFHNPHARYAQFLQFYSQRCYVSLYFILGKKKREKGRKTMARIYLNHPVAGLFYTV